MANSFEAELRSGADLAQSWDITASDDMDAGEVVVHGNMTGVVDQNIDDTRKYKCTFAGPVYKVPKAATSGSAITIGSLCYWDDTNNRVTTTASSHKVFGYAVETTVDADTHIHVLKTTPVT